MTESKSDGRLWLKRSDEGGAAEAVTESEREENDEHPKAEVPGKTREGTEGEKGPIWRGKPVLSAFYPFYLVGGLALLCTAVAELALPLPLWTVGVLIPPSFLVIVLPFALRPAWSFVLTGREAKSEFRLWVRRSKSAPLDEVTDVVVDQGPIARLLGFGKVRIDTAGTPFPGVEFWGIENPLQVEKKAVEAVKSAKDEQG